MRLSELLTPEKITVTLAGQSKTEIIETLLDLAVKTGEIKDRSAALKAVMEREDLMSTGLERGVAVPHAKTAEAEGLVMSLGISKDGLDFDSADGKPSHLFFFLLAPENAAGPNVKVLAQNARLTSDEHFRKDLKDAATPGEAMEIITKAE